MVAAGGPAAPALALALALLALRASSASSSNPLLSSVPRMTNKFCERTGCTDKCQTWVTPSGTCIPGSYATAFISMIITLDDANADGSVDTTGTIQFYQDNSTTTTFCTNATRIDYCTRPVTINSRCNELKYDFIPPYAPACIALGGTAGNPKDPTDPVAVSPTASYTFAITRPLAAWVVPTFGTLGALVMLGLAALSWYCCIKSCCHNQRRHSTIKDLPPHRAAVVHPQPGAAHRPPPPGQHHAAPQHAHAQQQAHAQQYVHPQQSRHAPGPYQAYQLPQQRGDPLYR